MRDTTNFVADANAGALPAVSWYLHDETEHPPRTACAGENATVNAVNAIMNGPNWKDTAIVVWWDEWGGFYDHVKPPTGIGIDDGVTPLNDLISYGFRVPLIVISPWVKRGPAAGRRVREPRLLLGRLVRPAGRVRLQPRDLRRGGRPEQLHVRRAEAGALLDFFDFSSATPAEGKLIRASAHVHRLSPAQQRYVGQSDDD